MDLKIFTIGIGYGGGRSDPRDGCERQFGLRPRRVGQRVKVALERTVAPAKLPQRRVDFTCRCAGRTRSTRFTSVDWSHCRSPRAGKNW